MDVTGDLSDQHVVPISSLNPSITPKASASLRAVIALVFPYSSATKSAAFLIAESDFRLRRNKGQVRVQLQGSAAKAVATSGIGIGDTVVLSLDGAKWAQDVPPISTPGRSVDGELIFSNRLVLEIWRNNQKFSSTAVDEPESEVETETIRSSKQPEIPETPVQKSHLEAARSGMIWDSPAAFSGSSQHVQLDDGGSPGKGRKRPRFSGGWTYARSSSSERQSSRSRGDSSDGEVEGSRVAEDTQPGAKTMGKEVDDPDIEEVVEPSLEGMERQEILELESQTSQRVEEAQQTMIFNTQVGNEGRMNEDAGTGFLLSSPLESLADRSRPLQTRTSADLVRMDPFVVEGSQIHENITPVDIDASLPEKESPPISQSIPAVERLRGVYTESDPNIEQGHRSARTGSGSGIQDATAQLQIDEAPSKDKAVIIDLISPTNDLPPSPPPSQPASQLQDLRHPSLPTPETTSSRLSDMVASLISQPAADPAGTMKPGRSKTCTPPSVAIARPDHTIPSPSQEKQPDEDTLDAAGLPLAQAPIAERRTEQTPPREETFNGPRRASKPADTPPAQGSSETAQEPLAESRSRPLSPVSAQALNQRLQETKAGFRTKHSYYTPLSRIESHLNAPSQGAHAMDFMGVATDTTSEPIRATKGPRDFSIVMHITDFSRYPDSVKVQILRPYKISLPIADIGDVVLLRNFVVKSQKRRSYLLSAEASAWVVWRTKKVHRSGVDGDDAKPAWASRPAAQHDVVKVECNGPPVEFGDEELAHALTLRDWWMHVDDGSFEEAGANMSNDNQLVAVKAL